MLQVMAVFATSSRQHRVFLNRGRISHQLMGLYRKLTTDDVEITADNFKVRETQSVILWPAPGGYSKIFYTGGSARRSLSLRYELTSNQNIFSTFSQP